MKSIEELIIEAKKSKIKRRADHFIDYTKQISVSLYMARAYAIPEPDKNILYNLKKEIEKAVKYDRKAKKVLTKLDESAVSDQVMVDTLYSAIVNEAVILVGYFNQCGGSENIELGKKCLDIARTYTPFLIINL